MEELVIRDGRCLNREDGNFEAKSARRGIPQSMWESYSAFANTSGGTIVLGLDESEDGTGFLLSGVKNASGIRDDLWSTLNNPEKISVNILTDRDSSRSEGWSSSYSTSRWRTAPCARYSSAT